MTIHFLKCLTQIQASSECEKPSTSDSCWNRHHRGRMWQKHMVRCLFFLKKRHLTAHNKATGFSTLPKFSVKLFFSSCLLHLHSTSSFLSTETEWVFLHCLLTWRPFTCDIFLSNLLLLLYICIYLFKSFILGSDVYSVNVETWLWRFIITLLILFLNCAVVLCILFSCCVFFTS